MTTDPKRRTALRPVEQKQDALKKKKDKEEKNDITKPRRKVKLTERRHIGVDAWEVTDPDAEAYVILRAFPVPEGMTAAGLAEALVDRSADINVEVDVLLEPLDADDAYGGVPTVRLCAPADAVPEDPLKVTLAYAKLLEAL